MLVSAFLTDVDLRDASLRHAELAGAIFSATLLAGADLTNAHLSRTIFAQCGDLHLAIGLDALAYLNASSVDLQTLHRCGRRLPAEFLDGVGVNRAELEALSAADYPEHERV
jgi:hypothetical protein